MAVFQLWRWYGDFVKSSTRHCLMANHAIIVAAGHGTRFGGDLPKQFLLLRDRPILVHAQQRFEQSALVEKVVVVAAPAWISYIEREIAGRFCFKKCGKVVAG